jgi:hypothetical protein
VLSDDNNSGLFTFLIGLIVLVMVGVGLSVLVDSRFSFSRSARDLEGAVATDKEEVKRLTALVDEYHFQLSNQQPKLAAANAELKELESSAADIQSKRKGLEARRDEIAASIPPLRSQFDDYRKKYRQQTWAAAIGESLGDLEIRGGRIYRKSIINKVSEVGLEIRHEDGIARIQGPDLSMEIQDRFQWDDAERMQRLQKEFADHNSIKDPDLAAKPPSKPAARETPINQARPGFSGGPSENRCCPQKGHRVEKPRFAVVIRALHGAVERLRCPDFRPRQLGDMAGKGVPPHHGTRQGERRTGSRQVGSRGPQPEGPPAAPRA